MRLLLYIELLTLLVLTHHSSASYDKKTKFAVLAPRAINLNESYSIVVTITESEKPVPFAVSLSTAVHSNKSLLTKEIEVLPNESEVCTFTAKEIQSTVPQLP